MIRRFWVIALAAVAIVATAIALLLYGRDPGTFSYQPNVGYMYEARSGDQEPVHFSKRVAQQAAESFLGKHWGIPQDARLDLAGALMGVAINTGASTIYKYSFEWRPEGSPKGLSEWGRVSAEVSSRRGRPFVNSAIYYPFGWPQGDRLSGLQMAFFLKTGPP
jgi:hypothetical protein